MATPHVAGAAALALAANPAAATCGAQAGADDLGRRQAAARRPVGHRRAPERRRAPSPRSTGRCRRRPRPRADRADPTATATPSRRSRRRRRSPPDAARVRRPPSSRRSSRRADRHAAVYLFDVTVGGSLLTKRSKLKVRFSLTKAATVRFSVTRSGSKKALVDLDEDGPLRRQHRHDHAPPADRADAQAGRPTSSASASARPRPARGRSESDSAPQRLRQRHRRQVIRRRAGERARLELERQLVAARGARRR